MLRFMNRFGSDSHARWRGTGSMTRVRRRNHQLNCEALEGRQLLSGYYIISDSSGNVLDNPGGSTSNGVQMNQWQINGGLNQQWNLSPQGGGNFQLVNAQNGQVIGDPGSSPYNGTQVIQWQSNPGQNELWHFDASKPGAIVNEASGLVLGDPGYSTNNGCGLIQWQWNAGQNERWTLLLAGNGPAMTYYVATADSDGAMVLDDPNSSYNPTTPVQSYYNGGANQQWTFVPLANGNDLIVNVGSGLVLDDPDFSTSDGMHLDLYQLNGGQNQQWQVDNVGYGNVKIVNAYSNLVLDDPNSPTSDGTPIDQSQWTGAKNKQWFLVKV